MTDPLPAETVTIRMIPLDKDGNPVGGHMDIDYTLAQIVVAPKAMIVTLTDV